MLIACVLKLRMQIARRWRSECFLVRLLACRRGDGASAMYRNNSQRYARSESWFALPALIWKVAASAEDFFPSHFLQVQASDSLLPPRAPPLRLLIRQRQVWLLT